MDNPGSPRNRFLNPRLIVIVTSIGLIGGFVLLVRDSAVLELSGACLILATLILLRVATRDHTAFWADPRGQFPFVWRACKSHLPSWVWPAAYITLLSALLAFAIRQLFFKYDVTRDTYGQFAKALLAIVMIGSIALWNRNARTPRIAGDEDIGLEMEAEQSE